MNIVLWSAFIWWSLLSFVLTPDEKTRHKESWIWLYTLPIPIITLTYLLTKG
jgi:hypothetical protein